MIVCVCHNVSESRVKSAIAQGLNNMPLLREHLEIGNCCGKCKSCAKKILRATVQPDQTRSANSIIDLQKLAA